jgi:hypothetical protein
LNLNRASYQSFHAATYHSPQHWNEAVPEGLECPRWQEGMGHRYAHGPQDSRVHACGGARPRVAMPPLLEIPALVVVLGWWYKEAKTVTDPRA